MNEEGEKKNKLCDFHTDTSPGSKRSYSLLDPNPSLIDINGNLINNINLAASLTTYRNGTIADGVSKLLIRIPYNSKLQFTIKDLASDDLSDGKLSSLIPGSLGEPMLSSSSVSVDSQRPTNGNPVVIAVYTPPDSFNQHIGSNKTIKINVSEPNNNSTNPLLDIPIQLYRPLL
jgi:hypothetical protein